MTTFPFVDPGALPCMWEPDEPHSSKSSEHLIPLADYQRDISGRTWIDAWAHLRNVSAEPVRP